MRPDLARLRSLYGAAALPGDVLAGRVQRWRWEELRPLHAAIAELQAGCGDGGRVYAAQQQHYQQHHSSGGGSLGGSGGGSLGGSGGGTGSPQPRSPRSLLPPPPPGPLAGRPQQPAWVPAAPPPPPLMPWRSY